MHLRCDVPLCFFASENSFLFPFSSVVYSDNFFDHATLKGVFDVLDEMKFLPSLHFFYHIARRAQLLDHGGQDRVNRLQAH